MSKIKKTNAMRILDQNKIEYEVIEYDSSDGNIDGISVANKINMPVNVVYKTLVVQGASRNHYVCIIPVDKNLNLKLVSKYLNEKKIEMIAVKDILTLTGYIRGGCSPLGMKKHFRTIVDISIVDIENIVFSAGKIGYQINMKSKEFVDVIKADIELIVD